MERAKENARRNAEALRGGGRWRALVPALVPALAAAAFGLAWFLANGGGAALSPQRVGWLLRGGDPATHLLGWAFFRHEPWRLPLGAIRGFAEPLGASLAFTDAIPLLGLAVKPFSPLLPPDFQYLGAWLALCFALQGAAGAFLGAAIGADRVGQFLTGVLFALSPPLLHRLGHEALCAHWILVALLALALRPLPDERAARRALRAAAALALVSAAIHPTLAAASAGLAVAVGLAAAAQGRVGPRRVVALVALVALGDAAVFAALGYGGVPMSGRGFGYFSADLLTLVNPMGWSRLLPDWPTRTPGQADGYAYLGAGGLALVFLALASRLRARARLPWTRLAAPVAICLIFTLFAVSSYVTLGGRKLFGTSVLPAALAPLVGPFRASGRFIWPLYYLLLAGAVAGTLSLLATRPGVARLALAAAAALQIADLGAGRVREHFAPRDLPSLDGWQAAARGYRHLALFPQRLVDADGAGCGGPFGPREFAMAYRAYRLGLAFNGGYLSRMDVARAHVACAAAADEVAHGRLRADTVYVPEPAAVAPLVAAGGVCGEIGGEPVCVAPDGAAPLRAQLAATAR